jgi:signal transduction histidine kinase
MLGMGIDENRCYFERFRQADDSLSRNYEGAGLGLYFLNVTSIYWVVKWAENNDKGYYFVLKSLLLNLMKLKKVPTTASKSTF